MKKVKIISMLLALVTVLLFTTSCTVQVVAPPAKTTAATTDSYPNHMNVNIIAYSAVDKNSNGEYIKVEGDDMLPIIGAPKETGGISIGYNNGDFVTGIQVLEQLAAVRRATLSFAGNNVDSIKMSGVTYKTDSVVNTKRAEIKKIDSEEIEVYYKDMLVWEWKVNDVVVKSISDVEIKDGDSISLTLVLDNVTKDENYVIKSEYDAVYGTTVAE